MKRNLFISSLLTLGLIACGGEETPNENNNKHEDTNSDVVVKSCDPGTFGPNCLPVTCVNGTANDGKDGDGKCASCNNGWSGDNCDECAEGYSGTNCDQCSEGYTGSNCNKITCVNGTLDSEAGICTSCNGNWDGDNCDRCKAISQNQMTDSECNIYKTVVINDKTWMAENLRVSSVPHYSVDDNSENDSTYGYLYTWENALKACPAGWSLPSGDEFLALIDEEDYYYEVETTSIQDPSWVSTATTRNGFNALPAGGFSDGNAGGFGFQAFFWSLTENTSGYSFGLAVTSSLAFVMHYDSNKAFSVRCIEDVN